MVFYTLSAGDKRGAIEILTDQDFPSGAHIPLNTKMKENNLFSIECGKKWFDVVQFANSFAHFAISKRFKLLLEENNVKGWDSFPIVIRGVEKEYFVFQVVSVAGEILNLAEVNNYKDKNREFDLSTWDHSGIFTLKNTLNIVCTQEVKDLIERAGITNVEFDEL